MKALAAIIGLLFRRGPTAILGCVVSMIVDAVNRITRSWSFSHVVKKVPEIIPSRANSNSSTTPSRPAFGLLIETTLSHMEPTAVFWPFFGMYCSTVFPIRSSIVELLNFLYGFFNSQAAAAFVIATAQGLAINNAPIPTSTKAIPGSITVWRICACS